MMSSTPTNQYPQGPSWVQRHGKTVLEGTALVGGVALLAGGVYFILKALTGGDQPPACTALQNDLQAYQQQLLSIYQSAAQQGGTFTSSQQAAVQSLQQEISQTIGQMSTVCVASPGTTLEETLNQIIVYGLWVAAIAIGLTISAFAVRWLIQRWGGSASKPGSPPTSPSDTDVSPSFNPASAGTDAANAEVSAEVEEGSVSSSEASTVAGNLVASDPSIGVSSDIADYFSNLASTVTEVAADFLEAASAAWLAISDALEAGYTEFLVFLGI